MWSVFSFKLTTFSLIFGIYIADIEKYIHYIMYYVNLGVASNTNSMLCQACVLLSLCALVLVVLCIHVLAF